MANDRRSPATGPVHSIRTRVLLATGALLLAALAAFWLCGRLVLGDLAAAGVDVALVAGALSRYVALFAITGGLLVMALAWLQGRLVLDPLTRMTEAIRALGERHRDKDCPRLDWPGRDEFAMQAAALNRMLETVSSRAVAVAQIEQRHKALIDGLPDAVAIFDAHGQLVAISKEAEGVERIPGFTPGQLPDSAVFGVPEIERFVEVLAETFGNGTVGRVRLKVQRPPGVPRSVPTRHFEMRLTRMDEYFALAIIRDVTAEVAEHKLRLEAEQRALDSSKRQSLTVLAAGIAHDMNNVLSVVLNAAESVDADPSGDSADTLDAIRDAVCRGSSMMRELMTFAGENKVTFLRTAPHLLMEDIRPLLSRVVGSNIDLTLRAAPDAPDVDADPNQFWKVPFNIIKNAGEAIGSRPGHIAFTAVPFTMTPYEASNFISESPVSPGPGVLFVIRDDGPGVPPELLNRIFDPYVSSKSLGRGLGLATVRTIVEDHGGGIRVSSRPDEGASFQIFLPESRLTKPADGAEAAAGHSADLSGEVLVVDNDEAILKTTSILLKSLNLTPHTARDRREALAVTRRRADRLRAIVLDAHLGGIDTVRLLGAFRIGAPNVPVVVVSGSSEEEMAEMFMFHPYDAFLSKPYTLADFKRVLTEAGRDRVRTSAGPGRTTAE